MKAIDFVSKIHEEGKAMNVWQVMCTTWDNDVEQARNTESVGGIIYDREEVEAALDRAAAEAKPEQGEMLEFSVWTAKVTPDDVADLDWEDKEEEGDLFCNDLDVAAMAEGSIEPDDSFESRWVEPHYKSLDRALLVCWSWQTHVGYARELRMIREGNPDEDESMTLPVDQVYAPQWSVIATAEELEGLDSMQRAYVVQKELEREGWKWTPRSARAIAAYLAEGCPAWFNA